MTGITGGQRLPGDADPGVTLFYFVDLVVVAVIAGVIRIRCRMAGLAGYLPACDAVVERKAVCQQHSRFPCLCRVAGITLLAEESGVDFRFLVAG